MKSESSDFDLSFPLLVGDGIENAHNARTMTHVAAMFGWECGFRDRADLAQSLEADDGERVPLFVTPDVLSRACDSLVAFDNGEGAEVLYGFRRPKSERMAVVVGNERRGIAGDMRRAATHRVEVPMASRRVNCLNVAAASAVALYYLWHGGGKLHTRADPHRNRPELLLLGAGDHIELGSTIRSAAAFGWKRAFVEDRAGVWFGCHRITRSEGRAAARRGKNTIRLAPAEQDRCYAFEEACIVTLAPGGRPLGKANLARGPRQLVVLVDEEHVDVAAEDLDRLATRIEHVTIERPQSGADAPYHYRIPSTIAMAEIARQVGVRAPKAPRRPRPPTYDRALATRLEELGETVALEDLEAY